MTHDIVISTDNVICGKCKLEKSTLVKAQK